MTAKAIALRKELSVHFIVVANDDHVADNQGRCPQGAASAERQLENFLLVVT